MQDREKDFPERQQLKSWEKDKMRTSVENLQGHCIRGRTTVWHFYWTVHRANWNSSLPQTARSLLFRVKCGNPLVGAGGLRVGVGGSIRNASGWFLHMLGIFNSRCLLKSTYAYNDILIFAFFWLVKTNDMLSKSFQLQRASWIAAII